MDRTTSIYLDLIRFIAAATVFVVHANYDRFTGGIPFFWRFQNLGNDAVMVFFVLSGFVIAYVSEKKERTAKEYMLSRFARLYSVVVPALLLTVICDYIGTRLDPKIYDGWWFQADSPIWRFLANLFFVNELWFSSIRPFSNGPFWSLGYEFWYYVLFAAATYVRPPHRYYLMLVLGLVIGPKILILFPIWLLGVWVYRKTSKSPVSEKTGWACFVSSIAAYILFRQADVPQVLESITQALFGEEFFNERLGWSRHFLSSYFIGALVALHFIGVSAISVRLEKIFRSLSRPINIMAGYTFALYLFHYPLLQLFGAVAHNVGVAELRLPIVLGGSLFVILVLGSVTERRKPYVKDYLAGLYSMITRKFASSIKS